MKVKNYLDLEGYFNLDLSNKNLSKFEIEDVNRGKENNYYLKITSLSLSMN